MDEVFKKWSMTMRELNMQAKYVCIFITLISAKVRKKLLFQEVFVTLAISKTVGYYKILSISQ